MKNLLIAGLLSFFLASCDKGQSQMEKHSEAKLDASKVQLSYDKDPICDMSVKNSFADTAVYQGKTIGFCSPGCKEEFKKEPAKYIKQ